MVMRKTLASVFSLLASYGLLMVGNGLFGTLIGIRTKIEGFSTEVVGLIVAAYFLGHGFQSVYSLRGGLDAWREQVDPSLPDYETG